MMNVISAIVSGLIVGVLARFFYPGAVAMSWPMTILLGIGGALLAGLVTAYSSGGGAARGYSRAGWIASILGAMLLIFIGHRLGWG
jgi:uncharacterized membrane protein YeaQ/YmgE (transglycosylase-associated protein family)